MATALAQTGIGIVHRNLNIKKQTQEIIKVKEKLLGASVGTNAEDIEKFKF